MAKYSTKSKSTKPMKASRHGVDDVRACWNEYVNDTEVTDRPVGSREFFDALERYGYNKIDYLEDYVDFPRFRGKEVLEIGPLGRLARNSTESPPVRPGENAARTPYPPSDPGLSELRQKLG